MFKWIASTNYLHTSSIEYMLVEYRMVKQMAITVRMNDSEQEKLRKKCIELNKQLINRNLMPIKESELVHIILEQCISNVELTTSGILKVIEK